MITAVTGKVIHRSKLFRGQDVREVYADVVFRGKACTTCRSPKITLRIQTFIALADMRPADREAAKLLIRAKEWKQVMLTTGPGVRVAEVFACRACQRGAETAAAHGPSYAVLTFDRLPDPDRPLVSVAGDLLRSSPP